LKDSCDDQLQNFTTIVSYFLDSNIPITADMFDTVVGRITTSGRRPLLWKQRLQDNEVAQKEAKEAAKQQPARDERTELVGENTLAPHLREHRRQMHAALAEAEAKKPEVQSANADAKWKQRAQDAINSIQSNNDRAEAEKFLAKAGGWGWELTLKQIQNFIERRKLQRSMAGR
jgi:hypothetical protein